MSFSKNQSVVVLYPAIVAEVVGPLTDPLYIVQAPDGSRHKVSPTMLVRDGVPVVLGVESDLPTDDDTPEDQFTGADLGGQMAAAERGEG